MRKPRFEKFCFKKEQRTEVVARTEWRTEVCVCVFFLNFLIIFFFFLKRNTDVFVGLWEQSGREGAV